MFDKNDVHLLLEAKDNGYTIDQIIKQAEKIVNREELKKALQNILTQMSYIAQNFLGENIEEIEALEEDDRLDFIIKKSYEKYLTQKLEEEKIRKQQEIISSNQTEIGK